MNRKLTGALVATLLGSTALAPAAFAQEAEECQNLRMMVEDNQDALEPSLLDAATAAAEAGDAAGCTTLIEQARAEIEGAGETAAEGEAPAALPAEGEDAAAAEDAAPMEGDAEATQVEPTVIPAEGAEADEGMAAEGEAIEADEGMAAEGEAMEADEGMAAEGEAIEPGDTEATVVTDGTEADAIEADEGMAAEGEALDPADADATVVTTEEPEAAEGTMAGDTEPAPEQMPWRTGRDAFMPPEIEREGFAATATDAISLEQIQGASVYGPEDEDIASVEDVIVGDDGTIQYFVMDVGGFLGIGARQVAVGFDEVTILANEGGDELRVYVGATEDELESLPEYEEEQG